MKNAIAELAQIPALSKLFCQKKKPSWDSLALSLATTEHIDFNNAVLSLMPKLANRSSVGRQLVHGAMLPCLTTSSKATEEEWRLAFLPNTDCADDVNRSLRFIFFMPLAQAFLVLRNVASLLARVKESMFCTEDDPYVWNGTGFSFMVGAKWDDSARNATVAALKDYPVDWNSLPKDLEPFFESDDEDGSGEYSARGSNNGSSESEDADAAMRKKANGVRSGSAKSVPIAKDASAKKGVRKAYVNIDDNVLHGEPANSRQAGQHHRPYKQLRSQHEEWCIKEGEAFLQKMKGFAAEHGYDYWDCMEKAGPVYRSSAPHGVIDRMKNAWNVFQTAHKGDALGMGISCVVHSCAIF